MGTKASYLRLVRQAASRSARRPRQSGDPARYREWQWRAARRFGREFPRNETYLAQLRAFAARFEIAQPAPVRMPRKTERAYTKSPQLRLDFKRAKR